LMNASAPASSLEGHGVQSTDRHALTIDGVESTDSVSGNDETGGPALNPNPKGFSWVPNPRSYLKAGA
jgi:hypothetical protein